MTTDIIGALGTGSGLNSPKLVKDLVEVQKAPLQARIDTKTSQADAQLSAYGVLKSSLSDFQSVLTPLTDPALFNAKALNVPTTDVITFNSLDAQAQAGSYQVEVESIASSQSIAFNSSETNPDAALGKTGTLTFRVGEWTPDDDSNGIDEFTVDANKTGFDITVTDDDTLASIAEKINGADSGVLASVVNIDGKLQLLVTAESGAKNALEITSDNSAQLSDFEFNEASLLAQSTSGSPPSVVQTQVGQDAKFKLNGLDVTRASNEIDDVITGLSFTLDKADVGNKVSFSISQDKSVAETAIKDFVEAYNTLQKALKPLVGVTTDDSNNLTRGDLSSDGTAKSLVSRLGQAISSTVSGLDSLDAFSALAAVGVTTALDGTINIDDEQFNKVIAEDFDKLSTLFGEDRRSSSTFLELNTGSFAGRATAGDYDVKITQAPEKGNLLGVALTGSTWDFSSSPLDLDLQVDGVSSIDLSLSGTYSSIEELAADLQSEINSNASFKEINAAVDVTVEAGALKITSRSFGDSSKVQIAPGTGADALGLGAGSVSTDGVNAQGTINGVEAFGSSNILLPAVDSPAYGLNITVAEGTPVGDYSVSFTRGIAGDLSQLISSALADGGQIDNREKRIEQDKKELVVDQEDLDRKMTAYQDRLSAQFAAMERIVASLNSTKSQLDGLIDRLPFTAKS